jgi:hypothetical protein
MRRDEPTWHEVTRDLEAVCEELRMTAGARERAELLAEAEELLRAQRRLLQRLEPRNQRQWRH